MERCGVSRRGVLAAGMASTVPSGFGRGARAAAPSAVSPVTATLSAYMAGALGRPLPADVAEKTIEHVLDTFAAAVSGSVLPPGRAALRYAATMAAAGQATVVLAGRTTGPIDAALVNGMLAQADETDDSDEASQSHPGCAVVPAAFAAAEVFGADGAAFVRAVALGYDIGPRFTIATDAVRFRDESHRSTHAIAGTFGAAAAAGALAGLDAEGMRWLLDYAAQQASGIGAWTRDTSHVEKSFTFAGMPARNGMTAALLVRSGFTGVDDILTGSDNFFAANAPGAKLPLLIDGLGTRYEITRTNIKKWSVGSPIQAVLDALDAIFKRDGRPNPARVRSVTVQLGHTEARTVDNRAMPDISVQHLAAVMLLDGTVSFAAAHDVGRMRDPAIVAMRAKVRLVEDPALEALEPARAAAVTIVLDDGRVLRARVTAVRGTAENPMSRAEVVAKARDLCGPVIGRARTEALVTAVLGLAEAESVGALRACLQGS